MNAETSSRQPKKPLSPETLEHIRREFMTRGAVSVAGYLGQLLDHIEALGESRNEKVSIFDTLAKD